MKLSDIVKSHNAEIKKLLLDIEKEIYTGEEEKIHWGHIGTMKYVYDELLEIYKSLRGE